MAKGAGVALRWYCIQSKIRLDWIREKCAKEADLILFYTEKPECDIWDFEESKKYGSIPKYYLLGNLDESRVKKSMRSVLENRLSKEQAGFINYYKLLNNAFYMGESRKFIEAAKVGNCFANKWFSRDIGNVIFSLIKYAEVYYGRNFQTVW